MPSSIILQRSGGQLIPQGTLLLVRVLAGSVVIGLARNILFILPPPHLPLCVSHPRVGPWNESDRSCASVTGPPEIL